MTIIIEADQDYQDSLKGDVKSKWRGHAMVCICGIWFYEDEPTPVPISWRPYCGYCGKNDTVEGHDGCLGTLSQAMNACCGHGEPRWAYIQHWDGTVVHDWTNLMASYPNRDEGLHT